MNRLHRTLLATLHLFFISALGIVLSAPVLQNRTHDPNRPEAVPVVVLPHGFSQQTFWLPAGVYAFVVVNRTGFREITCYLERMPGDRIDGLATSQEFGGTATDKNRLVRNARLTVGTYRLRVDGRLSWVSEIHVR
jgi:hypothetical protein